MANRKKMHEEKNLKLLRELAALPANKQCFDCNQRGPTYVNVTIGSFVCTSCSGILRGLHPPHRVKSITMTSFTPEEIEFIKTRGNDFCRYVWLGTYDSQTSTEPDVRDEHRIRDFMIKKYEQKRWYLDPDVAMRKMQQDRPQQSQSFLPDASAVPEVRPLSGLLGDQPAPLVIETFQQQQTPWAPSTHSMPSLGSNKSKVPTSVSLDLSKDFGGDPFKNSSSGDVSSTANGNFANFENAFSNTSSEPVTVATTNNSSSALSPPVTSTSISLATSTKPNLSTQDRYAALADLDSLFHQEPPSQPAPPTSSIQSWTVATSASVPFSLTPSSSAFFTAVSSNPFSNTTCTPSISTVPSQLQSGFSPSNPFQLASSSSPFNSVRPTNVAAPIFGQFGTSADEFPAFGTHSTPAPTLMQTPMAGKVGAPDATNFFSAQNGNALNAATSSFGFGSDGWPTSTFNQPVAADSPMNDFSVSQTSAFPAGQFGWAQPQTVQNAFNPFMLDAGTKTKLNPSNPFL